MRPEDIPALYAEMRSRITYAPAWENLTVKEVVWFTSFAHVVEQHVQREESELVSKLAKELVGVEHFCSPDSIVAATPDWTEFDAAIEARNKESR